MIPAVTKAYIMGRAAELERSLCSTSNSKHSFVGKTVNKEHMAQLTLEMLNKSWTVNILLG